MAVAQFLVVRRRSRFLFPRRYLPVTTQPKPKRPKWLRVILWSVTTFVALAVVVVCAAVFYFFYWQSFHPADATPIVGPAGPKYRAFIDDRSFQDIALIVCASDWPHTFREPFALGDVYFPQAYSSAKIFWRFKRM